MGGDLYFPYPAGMSPYMMVWEESNEPEAPVPTPTPVPEAPPALPRTGDSHPLMLYAVLMALSAGCIVMMMKKRRAE